jgi:hypothetical protein
VHLKALSNACGEYLAIFLSFYIENVKEKHDPPANLAHRSLWILFLVVVAAVPEGAGTPPC